LGLSENFGDIDFEGLQFPAHMYVDWIRVYQHPDRINIGCDPPNFPTSNYIETYIEAYTNPNLTVSVPLIESNCLSAQSAYVYFEYIDLGKRLWTDHTKE
jgi:hypothetical protein